MPTKARTFIIDCHTCRAKVAATEAGHVTRVGQEEGSLEPWGEMVAVGTCPTCESILVGRATQLDFGGYDAEEDRWSDFARVYPRPPKVFSSYRIPRVAIDSLMEADRALQANANIAASMMFGRALEAVCRDVIGGPTATDTFGNPLPRKDTGSRIMLGEGLKRLREMKAIDDRLYGWSQELHAFRNLAAHPEDITVSRADAEDLQTFVYAIVEYLYDLADRHEEFKERAATREKRKNAYTALSDPSSA